MKYINPYVLQSFHGLTTKHPDTFMFEFCLVCRMYDYITDEKNLNLFPSTINDVSLRWFMSLEGDNITSRDKVKQALNNKYQYDYRARDTIDEMFRREIFQLRYKRAHNCTLDLVS